MRSPDYRLTCCDCKEEWIGQPYDEQYETLCPECNSDDIEIGERYVPFRIQSFWILLLIPNLLLFVGCAQAAPAPTWQDGSHVLRLVESLANLHMRPMDRWVEAGTGYEPMPLDKEVHYALIIRPEDRGPILCYRMMLDYANGHYDAHHYSEKEPWVLLEESPIAYVTRKVAKVREALKSDLIDAYMKNDPERIETLTFGTSTFCRMPTEHSDPAKVKREDVVERK